MYRPSVSVIVPVYNCMAHLSTCLRSLRAQSLTDIEIIFVDDGSEDGSLSFLYEAARQEPRIRVLRQAHAGTAAARQLGIQSARGKYVGFTDADDYAEPEMYERLYRAAEETQADLAMCDYNEIHGSRRNLCKMGLQAGLITGPQEVYLCCVSVVPSLWNKLYRRELFSFVAWPLPLVIGEDMALCTMLSPYVKQAALVPEGLYNYVIHSGSTMRKDERLGNAYNQVDQFLHDIAPSLAFDAGDGIWKDILAARALSSLVFTRYSQGQGPSFFRSQIKKLSVWSGFSAFRRSVISGKCLRPLILSGGLSRSFSAAMQLILLLHRLHLPWLAATVMTICRLEIEHRQCR